MRDIVEEVVGHWKGLGLEFDEDVEVNTPKPPPDQKPKLPRTYINNEAINQDTRNALASNEEMHRTRMQEMNEEMEMKQEMIHVGVVMIFQFYFGFLLECVF